jgi:hypothetical protein
MQSCPLNFKSGLSEKYFFIENFEDSNNLEESNEKNDGKSCVAALVPYEEHNEEQNSYIGKRSQNINSLDKKYNSELSNYLETYNKYLLNKSMLLNASPGSASQAQLATATDKSKEAFLKSKENMEQIQKNLEKNNKSTNDVIKYQGENIKNKSSKIKQKDGEITSQSKLISEKNKILNSRTRQIELGITKNNYKRNVMWFLIIINIILICGMFGFLFYKNKK